MPQGQEMHDDTVEHLPEVDKTKYNQRPISSARKAYHGRGGNLSSRPAGENANAPRVGSSARFQKAKRRK